VVEVLTHLFFIDTLLTRKAKCIGITKRSCPILKWCLNKLKRVKITSLRWVPESDCKECWFIRLQISSPTRNGDGDRSDCRPVFHDISQLSARPHIEYFLRVIMQITLLTHVGRIPKNNKIYKKRINRERHSTNTWHFEEENDMNWSK
jgi:hypothetical protein